VQESMACGTPALVGTETAAGCPDAAAVLEAEEVDGPDAAARWERRIRELTARREARATVAAYAAANWSWDRCAGRYAELFRQLTVR